MGKDFNSVDYIKQVINEYDPSIDTRPSAAFHDLFMMPMTYMVQTVLDDIATIAQNQSIKNIEDMAEEDADALISNSYIERLSGGKATGQYRLYFSDPIDITVPVGTVALSSAGLRFLSTGEVVYTKETMALNIEGGYYYIDIPAEADDYGSEYSIETDDIVALESDINGVIRVSNTQRFVGGGDRETNAQLKERGSEAITVRNLLSARSINTLLYQNFPAINNVLSIGYYDPEMLRDTIVTEIDGTSYSIHIGGKVDIYTQTSSFTDATADTTSITNIPASEYRVISTNGTSYSTTTFVDMSSNFIEAAVQPGDILRLVSGISSGDYTIASITDANTLILTEVISSVGTDLAYEIKQNDSDWISPIVQITQIDRLDPGTQSPSGIFLYDGKDVLVDPKSIVNAGEDPEIALDSTDGIHCVYEYDNDIWYMKLSNAGVIETTARNVSNSSLVARNPDLTVDPFGNVFILWEDNDGTTGNYEIFRTVLGSDASVLIPPTPILNHPTFDYKEPAISHNGNGFNIVAIRNDIEARYVLIDEDFTTELAYTDFVSGTENLYTPKITTDNDYSFIVLNQNLENIIVYKIDAAGSEYFSGISLTDSTDSNILPHIGIDSTSNIYVCWDYNNTYVKLSKLDIDGNIVNPAETVFDFTGYTRAPRIIVDRSDMLHLAAIEDTQNSGDVHYKKLKYDFSALLEDILVQDQYNNANYIAMCVDSNRRPHIMWDSFDRRDIGIYYTKRQSQDYRIVSLKPNYRYSTAEIVNIHIDPYYESDYLRISYQYPHDLSSISNYVSGDTSLDRVVDASYLVKYPIPSFIDISLEYSGNDTSAQDLITEYINDYTGYELSVSDIMSAIPLSVSSRITTPFTIYAERHDIDGSIISTSSQNKITEPRITRFIARDIVIT